MDIRSLCQASTQLDGALTFHLLPFRPMAVEQLISEMERVQPHFRWVHSDGRVLTVAPPAHTRAVNDFTSGKTETLESDWTRENLWTDTHSGFVLLPPLTIDIDFHDEARADVQVLRQFWDEMRGASTADHWQAFQYMSTDVLNAWWSAYNQTRDKSASPAPIDPNDQPDAADEDAAAGMTTSTPSPDASPSAKPKRAKAAAQRQNRTPTPTP